MNLCQHPKVPAIPRKIRLHRVIYVLDLVICNAPVSFPSYSEFGQTNSRKEVAKERSIDTDQSRRLIRDYFKAK